MKLKNYIMSDNGKYMDDRVQSLSDLSEKEKKEYDEWSENTDKHLTQTGDEHENR